MDVRNTAFFPETLQQKIREQFYYLNEDMHGDRRLFFENAGGTLRLKPAVDKYVEITAIPDSPVRDYKMARYLNRVIDDGKSDVRLLLNAAEGEVATSLTASKIMFEMITTAASNVEKGNIVTTSIEHPSSYDACEFSSEAYGHELRVASADKASGSVPIENILENIDEETRLVSIILTSNITGAMHDLSEYTQAIYRNNPDAYIIVDGVQGAPHEPIDISTWHVDGINLAPYKMYGNRGVAFAWLSDRLSSLPHHRLLATLETNWILGSEAPAHYASFSSIVDYICMIGSHFTDSDDRRTLIQTGMGKIRLQEQAILNRLLNGSEKVRGTKDLDNVEIHFEEVNGPDQDLILALGFKNISNARAVERYAEHGIIVYAREATNHYSQRILDSIGLDSIVRVSPVHVHNKDDVDRFLEVTRMISEMQ